MLKLPILLFSISSFILLACNNNHREENRANTVKTINPAAKENHADNVDYTTEKFTGFIDGKDILFEHSDYVLYRFTVSGEAQSGNLNTERGFEKDKNATVYVMDHDKREIEQKYIVRLSSGEIFLLDNNRNIIPGALLTSVEW